MDAHQLVKSNPIFHVLSAPLDFPHAGQVVGMEQDQEHSNVMILMLVMVMDALLIV